MKLDDLFEVEIMSTWEDVEDEYLIVDDEDLQESVKIAYARQGDKIIRKYRCTGPGPKQGRIVSNPANCGRALNPKRRIIARKTYAAQGSKISRKRKKTMKRNPVSLRVQKLNKALRKK